MATICANCFSSQGPFITNWSIWNIPICKNTKRQPSRITECVERRAKSDTAKYKELLHPYDVA